MQVVPCRCSATQAEKMSFDFLMTLSKCKTLTFSLKNEDKRHIYKLEM